MSNAVYPSLVKGLTFTTLKTPEFSTIVQKAPSGAEVRLPQYQNPIWHWQLTYDYLYDSYVSAANTKPYAPYTDLQEMMGFYMARQGQYDDFLFTDPDDNSVGPALISGSPNSQAQLQLVNDGAGNYYSPIQRNMGGLFYEDITDLNGSITVYANSAPQSSPANYSVMGPGLAIPGYSFTGLYLKWTAAPTAPINAQFNFYFRVRFETDTQDFEKWAGGLWTIGGKSQKGAGVLKLVTSRPASL